MAAVTRIVFSLRSCVGGHNSGDTKGRRASCLFSVLGELRHGVEALPVSKKRTELTEWLERGMHLDSLDASYGWKRALRMSG